MWEGNQTKVKEFILHTLSINGGAHAGLFTLFLLSYTLTLLGNITIIMLVWSSTSLHKPMYIFLGNLSFVEIGYTTTTVPKILSGFLSQKNYISFTDCFLQYYFFFSFGSVECFLLTVMGYDRYLAICHPLRYNELMSSRKCFCLAAVSWAIGFLWTFVPIILISHLPFCGNKIDHILCDTGPLLELACIKNFVTELTSSITTSVVLLITFCFTCISYVFIIQTTVRIPSSSGRRKAFSTCASHLTVVIMFFGCAMFLYVRPSGKHPSLYMNEMGGIVLSTVTPFLNPIIYSLRNKEFIKAVKRVIRHLL
ncbi:olfactory receptor 6N2-like [Rhinatrema bivittatum]|uniref:olfactory receptor 6N2-like n=1 Tax=Rhinatrema bivittatum TaxID=194408 RepID=UPI00112C9D39|nr:olfactory receptor 6N2-like [Rhinatrema bivittatum]